MNVTVRNPGEREYRIRKFVVLKSSVHQILPEIKKGRIWKYTHKINLHKENTFKYSQTGFNACHILQVTFLKECSFMKFDPR